jgi:hypothetical protein
MIRRILLGAALVGASLSRLNCQFVFRYESDEPAIRQRFLGCFRGAITEPAGGEATVVLELPPAGGGDDDLIGCMTTPAFNATMAGSVEEKDRTQASFRVMPAGRPQFVLLVTRQPADGDATELDLLNESAGGFFRSADDIPRCAPGTPQTCAELALPQNFLPGGGQ